MLEMKLTTSPVIPPKLRVDIPKITSVTIKVTPSITSPVVSPSKTTGIIIIANASINFLLSFIICTKDEFDPTEAEFPKLAIKTIENFAKISLIKIALNKSNPVVSEIVTIIDIYNNEDDYNKKIVTDLYNKNFSFSVRFLENEKLPDIKVERWFSPFYPSD